MYNKYKVFANGKEIQVLSTDTCEFVILLTESSYDLEIIVDEKIENVDLCPLRRKKKFEIYDSNRIKFNIQSGEYYSVEVNGDLERPLLVFTDEYIKPSKYEGYDLIYFKKNTVHNIGVINLSSNSVLFIDEGAIVNCAVKADSAQNIQIIGNGIINCTNEIDGILQHPILLEHCNNVNIYGSIVI